MLHQRLADFAAEAVHDVEHAGRETDLRGEFAEHPRSQRRDFAGLADHAVARRQCRRDLPGEQVQRQVPRADAADHAQRLPQRDSSTRPRPGAIRWRTGWRPRRRNAGCSPRAESRRRAPMPVACRRRAIRPGRNSSRRSSRASASRFSQRPRSLAGKPGPGRESGAGCGNGVVDVACVTGRAFRELRTGRRFEHIEPAIAGRRAGLAVDRDWTA